MTMTIQKRHDGLYFWEYGSYVKLHHAGMVCKSYRYWKTKKACLVNAIKFSKSLSVPVSITDHTMSRIMSWGTQAVKFIP